MEDKKSKQPPIEYYDEKDSDNVCFLCKHPNYQPVYTIRHFGFPFQFKKCQCGIVKQTPMPNPLFFEWFFNSEVFYSAKESQKEEIWGFYDYFKDENCRLATSKYRYKRLSYIFEKRRPLNIMKVGPSTGTFLYVAKQHGHHALGCDISHDFSEYAKKTYNAQIDQGRFEKMGYADGQFDVLLLFNVIENIPNLDEFLKAVQKKVKLGGFFILNHVEMNGNLIAFIQKDKYFLYRPPVCYLFDKDVLRKMLSLYGFEIVQTFNDWRYLHLEKIFTLLRWKPLYLFARWLGIHLFPFKIYAYPSKIVVAQRKA